MQAFRTLILVLAVVHSAFAADDTTQFSIKLTGAYLEGYGLVLRWAQSSPGSWRVCNYYGYKIERAVFREGVEGGIQWTTLADSLRPQSLESWRRKVKANPTDTLLMVAGQAIHGKVNPREFSIKSIQDKSAELSNLYAACVLASEYSRDAALFAAMRFEDASAIAGEHYLYRVSPNTVQVTGAVIALAAKPTEYPKVIVDTVNEGERKVELLWKRDIYKEFYSAFNVYRLNERKQKWEKLNGAPVASTGYKKSDYFIYRDSLTENYRPASYRIEGLTSFGNLGPMSDVIHAQGRDRTPPDAPTDVRFEYLGNGLMKISWRVAQQDIEGFRISKSNEKQKEFVEITHGPLPKNARSYIDSTCNEMINNYYWIGVFDAENNVNVSFPNYGTIIDSIPPGAPEGVTGSVDTNGVVTLSWKLGPEPDLKGYYVHSSNHPKQTYINRTGEPLRDTFWTDTLPLNVLTEDIYYKIVAIDHRSNYSQYSKVLHLRKPDLVPPSAPVFTGSVSDKNGNLIRWNNSSSHDVRRNYLLRRKRGDQNFISVFDCPSTVPAGQYLDKDLKPGETYEYTMEAEDDAGLRSGRLSVLSLRAYLDKTLKPVSKVVVEVDTSRKQVSLYWNYPNKQQQTFVLYRATKSQSFVTHKVLKATTEYREGYSSLSDSVRYRIKVINDEGWQSEFSEVISVK